MPQREEGQGGQGEGLPARRPAADAPGGASPTETPAAPNAPPPRTEPRTLSRRELLRLLRAAGISAGAAALVPGFLARAASTPPSASGTVAARVRKWAMVIDLRRCDGCQGIDLPPQCTQACIEGHYAPAPMEWIQVYEEELPGGGTHFLPMPCMQCQNAPCLNVCPVGATFATPEGAILVDQERCIGCRICMAACPYDRRFFNWGRPPAPPEAGAAPYDPEHQAPARAGTVMKCDFCPDLARAGKLPYCAQGCPTHAIYYGDLEEDLASNGEEVVPLSRLLSQSSAYRLKEDLGTQPRVFYLPGLGQAVGRDPEETGRRPTEWPWPETAEGAASWQR